MQILTARGGLFATNAFLIADEATSKAVLFDAPDHTVGVLINRAKQLGWDVIGLWLTHGHIDHIADHAAVTEAFPNAKVLVHAADERKLLNPNAMIPLPFVVPPAKADGFLLEGQKLQIGGLDVEVIFTPGHSPGHVCFYFPREELLVGGDLIICGAVGRTDFPDSNHANLNHSIRRIMKLPAATRLLPGHCDPSTLGHELETNEYVQAAVEEAG